MSLSLTYSPINAAYDDVKSSTRSATRLPRFLRWILRGFEKRIIRDFTRINTEFEGILNMILEKKYDLTYAVEDYHQFKKIVTMLTLTNTLYRDIEYLGNEQVDKLINHSLTLAYEIEAELKIAAHAGRPIVTTDEAYKKALAKTSSNAINKKLSHQF